MFKSEFGYHLVWIEKVIPERKVSFDDAREESILARIVPEVRSMKLLELTDTLSRPIPTHQSWKGGKALDESHASSFDGIGCTGPVKPPPNQFTTSLDFIRIGVPANLFGFIEKGSPMFLCSNPARARNRLNGFGLFIGAVVLLWSAGSQTQDRPSMRVDSVTSASPRFAEQGAQINLWIEGSGFASGAEVTFNVPGITQETDPNGVPYETTVYLNTNNDGGERVDGIQFFARIAGPADMPTTPPDS